jgi:hypothetical protein
MKHRESVPPRCRARATSYRQHKQVPALPANLNDHQVLTFQQWIALNGISPRTGRRILNAPGAPIVTRLSPRRIGITVANNRAWQASREHRA